MKQQFENDTEKDLWFNYNNNKNLTNLNNLLLYYYNTLSKTIANRLLTKYKMYSFEELQSFTFEGLKSCIEKFSLEKGNNFIKTQYLRIYGSVVDEIRRRDDESRNVTMINNNFHKEQDSFFVKNGRTFYDAEEVAVKQQIVDDFNKIYCITRKGKTYNNINKFVKSRNLLNFTQLESRDNKNIIYNVASKDDECSQDKKTEEGLEELKKIINNMKFLNLKGRNTESSRQVLYNIIKNYYYDDLTMEEIGKKYKVSESCISQRLKYFYRYIRNNYKKKEIFEKLLK